MTRDFRELALSCHGFAHFAVLRFTTALPQWLSISEGEEGTNRFKAWEKPISEEYIVMFWW